MRGLRWAFQRFLWVRVVVLYAIHWLPVDAGNWLGERVGLVELLLEAGLVTADDVRRHTRSPGGGGVSTPARP